jgi:hypothetical protein
MKQLILMVISMLMAGVAFTACSSDNNDTKPEEMVLDADTLQVFDGFDLKFQMLDDKGRPVTKFKEGENFTFKVVVTNKRKEMFQFPTDFLGNDAFHIFSANGADLGKPWDAVAYWGAYFLLYQSESAVVSCKAFGKSGEDFFPQSIISYMKYSKDRDPLPKGSYYTEFELALNAKGEIPGEGSKGIVCRKAFTIE